MNLRKAVQVHTVSTPTQATQETHASYDHDDSGTHEDLHGTWRDVCERVGSELTAATVQRASNCVHVS